MPDLDLAFTIAGASFLLGAIALAVWVDRTEARQAAAAPPWAPVRLDPLEGPRRRMRLLRLEE